MCTLIIIIFPLFIDFGNVNFLLGYEVDKPLKILIKPLNITK